MQKIKTTLVCLLVLTAVSAHGQNFTPQNGRITQWDNETLAVFDAETENKSITSTTLGLKKKPLEKFIDLLEKYGKKAKEWAQTAQREGVKDYKKELYGASFRTIFASMERVGFVVNGESYSKDYSNTLMSMDTQSLGYPQFVVNSDGECFMYFSSSIGTLKVATGKSFQTTTTVNSGGILNPHTTVGHTTSREMNSYDLGYVKIWIRVADVDAFTNHLKQLVREFDNQKANKKATDKLFK